MVRSWGLIDKTGIIRCGTPDFTVTAPGPLFFTLKFDRPVDRAVVVATPRNLDYCDDRGVGLTVCNQKGDPMTLGFFVDSDHLGFSFMLIDECPVGG